MKTTIEKERKDRGINENFDFITIGKEGSLIPRILTDSELKNVSVLFCESISGGLDSTKNFPNRLNLTHLYEINGKLYRCNAEYHLDTNTITEDDENN